MRYSEQFMEQKSMRIYSAWIFVVIAPYWEESG